MLSISPTSINGSADHTLLGKKEHCFEKLPSSLFHDSWVELIQSGKYREAVDHTLTLAIAPEDLDAVISNTGCPELIRTYVEKVERERPEAYVIQLFAALERDDYATYNALAKSYENIPWESFERAIRIMAARDDINIIRKILEGARNFARHYCASHFEYEAKYAVFEKRHELEKKICYPKFCTRAEYDQAVSQLKSRAREPNYGFLESTLQVYRNQGICASVGYMLGAGNKQPRSRQDIIDALGPADDVIVDISNPRRCQNDLVPEAELEVIKEFFENDIIFLGASVYKTVRLYRSLLEFAFDFAKGDLVILLLQQGAKPLEKSNESSYPIKQGSYPIKGCIPYYHPFFDGSLGRPSYWINQALKKLMLLFIDFGPRIIDFIKNSSCAIEWDLEKKPAPRYKNHRIASKAMFHCPALASQFIADEADPENSGNNPLHCAVLAQNPKLIRLCLYANSRLIESRNKKGYTPLSLAYLKGFTTSINAILSFCYEAAKLK